MIVKMSSNKDKNVNSKDCIKHCISGELDKTINKVEIINSIKIFTDGACSGNPGPGGWGFHISIKNNKNNDSLLGISVSGGSPATTNNRMEMRGMINALAYLNRILIVYSKKHDLNFSIIVFTDSSYVLKGITEWRKSWEKSGRLSSTSLNCVKNLDLWKEIYKLADIQLFKKLEYKWIRGHDKIHESDCADIVENKKGNIKADLLAREGVMMPLEKMIINIKE